MNLQPDNSNSFTISQEENVRTNPHRDEQLYNLKQDRQEKHNIIEKKPEIYRRMSDYLTEWEESVSRNMESYETMPPQKRNDPRAYNQLLSFQKAWAFSKKKSNPARSRSRIS